MLAPPKPTGLLLSSLALALLAVFLLSGAAWGVNLGLWAVAVALVAGRSSRLVDVPRSAKGLGLMAVGFAVLDSLRDSDSLRVANGFAMAFCLGGALLTISGQRLRDTSVMRMLGAPFTGLASLAVGAVALTARARDDREASAGGARRSKAIVRGLLLALPLLVLFGALFASADAVFRRQVEGLGQFDLNVDAVWDHLLTAVLGLTFAGGLLYRLNLAGGPRLNPSRPSTKPIGMIEGGIVLGSLAALFGSFLLVQFRYLFGAQDVVKATKGLSYAEYARGGFFELVIVAALTLVVLVGADASLKRDRSIEETFYRWLGRILGGMVFLIIASALIRMRLYTAAFGLTELRIYSTVFMLWLALAFVWLFATTLAGHPRRFAFGILVAGLGVILATNLANPDRLIARTNLSKPKADFAYLATLGDDAALTLREMRDEVPLAHRSECDALLRKKKAEARKGNWRELNLGRLALAR